MPVLIQKPELPGWADPKQRSVFDAPGQGLLRTVVGWLGLDDPNQVMAFGTPLETGAATGGLVDAIAAKLPRFAKAIKAFHGSPHDIPAEPGAPLGKFSTAKIGTGEGAQAYGHGLYFAENEGIARSYRDQLSKAYSGTPDALAQDALRLAKGDTAQAVAKIHDALGTSERIEALRSTQRAMADAPVFDRAAYDALEREHYELQMRIHDVLPNAPTGLGHHEFKKQATSALEALNSGKSLQGHMYEVGINADPAHMLDWDKPLGQQSAHVQEALSKAGITAEHATGAQIYESTKLVPGQYADKVAAAARLQELGIPGIKYLDQGSRAAGAGTRNFVIFDDATIDILKKYGVLPAAVGAGGAAAGAADAGTPPMR
jgi:hypothetical protein